MEKSRPIERRGQSSTNKDHIECPFCGKEFPDKKALPSHKRICKNYLEYRDKLLTKEFLEEEYIKKERSAKEIADEYGLAVKPIIKKLEQHKIPQRSVKESINKKTIEKREQTSLEKYGVKNPSSTEEVRQKVRDTSLERYGVDNVSKSEDVKLKIQNTFKERYGTTTAMHVPEFKERHAESIANITKEEWKRITEQRRSTNIERYGGHAPQCCTEVQNQTKETCLEKYGHEFVAQVPTFREKRSETCLERYGFPNALQSEEVKEKSRRTNLEVRGVPYPSMSAEVKEKIKKTNEKRYGIPYGFLAKGIEYRVTKIHKKVMLFLDEENIPYTMEYYFDPYFIDIKLNDANYSIEINGDYFHANRKKHGANDILHFPGNRKYKASDIWEIDRKRLNYLRSNGLKILVLWECDIKTRFEDVKKWILKFVKSSQSRK